MSSRLTTQRDQQFLGMLAGYRCSGGLNRARDVSRWLEDSNRHRPGTLARWVAHNEVIHLDWQMHTWLPMFQFDTEALVPRVTVGLVLLELQSTFDNWQMAQWFATTNTALEGRSPAEMLGTDPARVVDVARRVGPRPLPHAETKLAMSLR